jgi:hypothetical protein
LVIREHLDQPGYLAQAYNTPLRNVSYSSGAGEWQQVMLAHAGEADAANDNHLVACLLKDRAENFSGVHVEARRHFAERFCHAAGRVAESFSRNVLADP